MATLMASSTVGMLSSRTHLSSSSRQPISSFSKATSFADLRFVCSQLSGLQISHDESIKLKPICVPTKLPFQPVARNVLSPLLSLFIYIHILLLSLCGFMLLDYKMWVFDDFMFLWVFK